MTDPAAARSGPCSTCAGFGWISDGYNTIDCTCEAGTARQHERVRLQNEENQRAAARSGAAHQLDLEKIGAHLQQLAAHLRDHPLPHTCKAVSADVDSIARGLLRHGAALAAARLAHQQEIDDAMKVLAPNMPSSGLVDACRQVKQAQISDADNARAAEVAVTALRQDLQALAKEWDEIADFEADQGNPQYADGLYKCARDLADRLAKDVKS